jgi:hypothetical protein
VAHAVLHATCSAGVIVCTGDAAVLDWCGAAIYRNSIVKPLLWMASEA